MKILAIKYLIFYIQPQDNQEIKNRDIGVVKIPNDEIILLKIPMQSYKLKLK